MPKPANTSGRINDRLWDLLRRFQRLSRPQRLVIKAVTAAIVIAAVYLWVSTFDCPIC